MNLSAVQIANFIHYLENIATSVEYSAGMNGSIHDGGAREIRNQIEAYRAGLHNIIPDIWQSYWKTHNKEQDPEYNQYLELKKKFERN